MITFTGEYPCKIDAKGRLLFPVGLKRQMGKEVQDRFGVRKNIFTKCLDIYPWSEWELLLKKMKSRINPYNRQHNEFITEFFKGTADITLDSSGRMLVPKWLVDWLEIKNGDIMMVGQNGRIQLWDNATYNSRGMSEEEFASLAEKLLGNQTFNEED